MDEKCWRSRPLKILRSENLQSASDDPKLNSKTRICKVPYMQFLGQRVPNFHPLHSTISCFQNIAHFAIFLLTPMLKFQNATNKSFFSIWQIAETSISLYSTMIAKVLIHKVWVRTKMETVGGVPF